MANSLAPTSFESGPDDDFLAIDVYEESGGTETTNRIHPLNTESPQISGGGFGSDMLSKADEVLSRIKSMSENAVSGAMNALSQAFADKKRLASKATSLIAGTAQEYVVNKAELTERSAISAGDFSTTYRGLTSDVKEKIITSTPINSTMLVTSNDSKYRISASELKRVNSIADLVNDYTKNSKYKTEDTAALAGTLGAVIGTAAQLRVPNAYENIASSITDNRLLINVTKAALPHVMNSGDFSTIKAISESAVGKMIEVIAPGTTSQVAKVYQAPKSYHHRVQEDHSLKSVIGAMDNFNKGWDSLKRGNNAEAVNIVNLLNGSDDFYSLLRTGARTLEPSQQAYAAALVAKKTTVAESLKKDFPAVSTTSLNRTKSADPKIVSPNMLKT